MDQPGKLPKQGKPVKLKLPSKRTKLTEEEKRAKQEQEDLDKALKKSLAEQKRAEKTGNAIKSIVVMIPPATLIKYPTLTTTLETMGVNHEGRSTSETLENVITFRRDTISKVLNDLNILIDHVRTQDEDNVIILMYPEEVIPLVHAQLEGKNDTLIERVEILQTLFSDKKVTLFFMELDKYFKKQKRALQQEYRQRVLQADDEENPARKKTKKSTLPEVFQPDLNSALIELQLMTKVNYRIVNKDESLAERLFQLVKAIADAPYKRQKMSNGFDWYALADTAGSIKVDKDGNGLFNLWLEQLMQFNTVGIETAKAIQARYPSPRALLTAYDNCTTVDEGLLLLQKIKVERGIGPLARKQNIGPEISKRIYRFFTVRDGDRCLSHSQDV